MPGGHRVHILGGRHDGLMARPALNAERVGLNTPHGTVPAGMHAAQFSKTAVRLRAAGLAAATPKTGRKKSLSPERPHQSQLRVGMALGSRTLLSRSASSATEEYSAARHEQSTPRPAQDTHGPQAPQRHGSALDPQPLVAPLSDLHHSAVEAVERAGRADPRPPPARRSAPLPARSGAVPRCG